MDGEIPEGWMSVALAECVDRITAGATPKAGDPRYYKDGTIPFARIEDVVNAAGGYLNGTELTVTEAAVRETAVKVYPPGTPLMTMYGTIGAVAVTSRPTAANQAIAAFVGPRLAAGFFRQLLLWHGPRLARLAGQTTQANISGAILKRYAVVVPERGDEQELIGQVLDAIDEAIEKTEAVIAATEHVRKALLQELLTRGVPGWHTEWKTVPGIGTVPACWEVVRGDSIVKLGGGYAPADFAFDDGGDVLFVKVDDLNAPGATRYVTDAALRWSSAAHARVKPVPPPFIVLPKRGAAIFQNKVAIVQRPAVVDPNLMTVQPLAGASIEFLRYLFSHTQLPRLADNSGVPQLNNKHIYPHEFALPSCREQQAIASLLISLEDVVKQERAVLNQAVHAKSIAAEALLTGRVRVAVHTEVGRG